MGASFVPIKDYQKGANFGCPISSKFGFTDSVNIKGKSVAFFNATPSPELFEFEEALQVQSQALFRTADHEKNTIDRSTFSLYGKEMSKNDHPAMVEFQ